MPEASEPATIAERLAAIRRRIEAACERSGREASDVTLLGAAKRQPVELLREAFEAGLHDFGENRVQEAEEKRPQLPADSRWHLIGPLQSNKARRAVELFDVVHSVDRLKIARVLDAELERVDRRLPCFVEVNLGQEASKHGFAPAELEEAVRRISAHTRLDLRGLMAIPPPADDEREVRGWFRRLRELGEALQQRWPEWPGELSMGMSSDFEIAIEEGATHVRVGTALFGPRPEPR